MAEQFQVTVANPCFANWNEMRPNERGAYCTKCSFNVIDFTKMTDAEVLETLTQATGKICGRFNNEQINRPITKLTPIQPKRGWKALVAGLAAFWGMKDLHAGTPAINKTPFKLEQLDTVSWRPPDTIAAIKTAQKADTVKRVEIRGRVVGKYRKKNRTNRWQLVNKPIVGVEVSVSNSKDTSTTDSRGYFKLTVDANKKSIIYLHPKNYPFASKDVPVTQFLSQKHPLKVVLGHYTYWMGCPKF